MLWNRIILQKNEKKCRKGSKEKMKPKTITLRKKFNLGNFEMEDIEISMELEEDDDLDVSFQILKQKILYLHSIDCKEVGNKMAYEKIEIGVWKPENPNDEIEGVYIKMQEDVGANHSNVYTLEVEKKPVTVWGSAVLDAKMTAIKPGDKIKIVYLGLGEAKPGKNAPKQFDVFVDRPDSAPKIETIKIQ